MGSCHTAQGTQFGALWQPRGVGRGGRDVQERQDMCIPTADSCWCMKENNTTLYGNYPPIKKTKCRQNRPWWGRLWREPAGLCVEQAGEQGFFCIPVEALTQVNELRSRSVSKEDKQKVSLLRQRGNKSWKEAIKTLLPLGWAAVRKAFGCFSKCPLLATWHLGEPFLN